MKSMMVGMVAVVFGCLVGCAASEEPTSEPTTDEVSENESAIVGSAGKCQVTNGVLDGKCDSATNACTLLGTNTTKCPVGATPLLSQGHYCSGVIKYWDFNRGC